MLNKMHQDVGCEHHPDEAGHQADDLWPRSQEVDGRVGQER